MYHSLALNLLDSQEWPWSPDPLAFTSQVAQLHAYVTTSGFFFNFFANLESFHEVSTSIIEYLAWWLE